MGIQFRVVVVRALSGKVWDDHPISKNSLSLFLSPATPLSVALQHLPSAQFILTLPLSLSRAYSATLLRLLLLQQCELKGVLARVCMCACQGGSTWGEGKGAGVQFLLLFHVKSHTHTILFSFLLGMSL